MEFNKTVLILQIVILFNEPFILTEHFRSFEIKKQKIQMVNYSIVV